MEKCWCGNDVLRQYSNGYYVCDKCHTLITRYEIGECVDNVRDDGSDLYGEQYWTEKMLSLSGKQSFDELIDMYISERAAYWLEVFLKYCQLTGGKVVEIGCGLGQFSYLLQMAGFSTEAYELSPNICRYIREHLGIDVHRGPFKALKNTYDAVIAMDLIEHVNDPKTLLESACLSLRDNGILVIQTPSYDPDFSYDDIIGGNKTFGKLLIPNEHLLLFSKKSMEKLLKDVGFVDIRFEHAFFGDDYDMFVVASKTRIEKNDDTTVNDYLNGIASGRLIKALISNRRTIEKLSEDIFEIYQQYEHYKEAERLHCLRLIDILVDETKKNRELENKINQIKSE